MKISTKLICTVLSVALLFAATTALVACGGPAEYAVEQNYTDDNKAEIPDDAVNKVMFAYSEDVDVTFTTKLTLDDKSGTYTLYKSISTAESRDEATGETMRAFYGQYEFTGDYTVDAADSNKITLKVPDSGRVNIYYPTVLNYQSVEKQTQDWVSDTERPDLLTRFNKWYPAKNTGTVDQPVTLSGNTMTFGEVTFPGKTPDPGPENPDTGDEEEDMSGWGLDENALTSVGAGGKALNFYDDHTFAFVYNFDYGETVVKMEDKGAWVGDLAAKTVTLTVTPEEGEPVVCSGTLGTDNKIVLNYTYSQNTVIQQTFELTFGNWSVLLGVSAG